MRPGYSVSFEPIDDKNKSSRFAENLSSTVDVDPFFTVSLRNVSSVGSHGLLITSSGKLLWETHQGKLEEIFIRTWNEFGTVAFLWEILVSVIPVFGQRKIVSEAAYLFPRIVDRPEGAGVNFGHWMLEALPQLQGVEYVQNSLKRKMPLFVNPGTTEWQKESLDLMGFGSNKLIEKGPNSLRFKHLLLSSTRNVHSQGMEFDPLARKWVRERLTSNSEQIESVGGSATAALQAKFRQNHTERKIHNYEDVKSELESLGFSCESGFEISTLKQELARSSHTEILIAVFGSNIARVLLMPNLSQIVEIYTQEQQYKDVFFWLCMELEISYSEIQIRELSAELDSERFQTKSAHFAAPNSYRYLDPDELKKRLSKL